MRLIYALVGVLALAGCIVYMAPATLLAAAVGEDGPARLTRVHGRIWDGSAAVAYQGHALGSLSWQFAPASLLQGEADPVIDLGLPRGDNTLARELIFSTLHLLAFGVTSACWFWALSRAAIPRRALLAACTISLALGLATEILQSYTLDRHASWLDLAANIGGAMIATRFIWGRLHSG